jgi:hypothetical protein
MAKSKAKKIRSASVAAINDPTPERMARDDWSTVDPRTLPSGNMMARSGDKPRKQASRVERMLADGWIDRRGAKALEIYENKLELSGYGNVKSQLDMSGGGGSTNFGDGVPPCVRARDWVASVEFAVRFDVDDEALQFVRAVLLPYGGERLSDVAERMIPGGQRHRMEVARDRCGAVAEGIATVLER